MFCLFVFCLFVTSPTPASRCSPSTAPIIIITIIIVIIVIIIIVIIQVLSVHCTQLKKVSVRGCEMVGDPGVSAIARACRGLQQLNIQDCTGVTLDSYRTVKRHCQRCIIEHTNPGFH